MDCELGSFLTIVPSLCFSEISVKTVFNSSSESTIVPSLVCKLTSCICESTKSHTTQSSFTETTNAAEASIAAPTKWIDCWWRQCSREKRTWIESRRTVCETNGNESESWISRRSKPSGTKSSRGIVRFSNCWMLPSSSFLWFTKKSRVSTLRRSSVERNWLRPQIGRMITSPWCTAFRRELLRL